MSVRLLLAALGGALIAQAAHRRSRESARRLLDAELPERIAEAEDAARALNLPERETERLLRRCFGGEALRIVRAASPDLCRLERPVEQAAPRSQRGRRHD